MEDLTIQENLEYACRLRQPVTTSSHQVLQPDQPNGLEACVVSALERLYIVPKLDEIQCAELQPLGAPVME